MQVLALVMLPALGNFQAGFALLKLIPAIDGWRS